MIADNFLSQLEGVKRIGADRWLARCPAHDDRRPSLSIREMDGEKVLVHCWAGCSVGDVLGSVGLAMDTLFPPRTSHRSKPEGRPWPATDVLRALEYEALIVATAASFMGNGGVLTKEDRHRLLLASERITSAVMESCHD
jgi:hypothetical protein